MFRGHEEDSSRRPLQEGPPASAGKYERHSSSGMGRAGSESSVRTLHRRRAAVFDSRSEPRQPIWLGAQKLEGSPALVGTREAFVEQVGEQVLNVGGRLSGGAPSHFTFHGLQKAQDAGKFSIQFKCSTRGHAMFAKISQLRPSPNEAGGARENGGLRKSGSYENKPSAPGLCEKKIPPAGREAQFPLRAGAFFCKWLMSRRLRKTSPFFALRGGGIVIGGFVIEKNAAFPVNTPGAFRVGGELSGYRSRSALSRW